MWLSRGDEGADVEAGVGPGEDSWGGTVDNRADTDDIFVLERVTVACAIAGARTSIPHS